MASAVADELLNDFLDQSDEEGEEQEQESLLAATQPTDGKVELDGDEEDVGEADTQGDVPKEELENEAEIKARVEKMQLRGVADVRSVAVLMKQLMPVLQVSPPSLLFHCACE
jgi:U4/U6 small nuclear ribonucleoprotein PRP31